MNLKEKIEKYLGYEPNFETEVIMQDDSDGKGAYIREWNIDGALQPTKEQLDKIN